MPNSAAPDRTPGPTIRVRPKKCARKDSNSRQPGSLVRRRTSRLFRCFSVVPLFRGYSANIFRTCTYRALTRETALQHEERNRLILLVVREGLEPSTSAL